MPYSITGSGVIDLRSTMLQADGLAFNTSGAATAQVSASQFGVNPGNVALNGTITGSQFADTMEFFVSQSSFSAGGLTFANWSANDALVFRALTSAHVAATAQRDTFIYGGGGSHFDAYAGDDVLVADFSFATNGYNVNTYDFSADANGYTGDLTTAGWVQGRVSFTGVNRFDYTGTQFNDNIRTGDNADTVNGGDGNDIINSGKGADVIDGGAGTADRWIADRSTNNAVQAMTLDTRANIYIGPGSVTNIEAVQLTLGAGNDFVTTSIGALNDTILGGGGNDTISVAQGEDRFEGGAGNDLLVADFSAATTYNLNSGGEFAPDASGYSGQFFTGGRIEGAVVFTGVERFDVTGTKFDDVIRTGDNADTLTGGAGNDTLSSGKGADVIDGGSGTGDKWIADKSGDGAGQALSLNTRTNTYSGPGSVTNIESVQLSLGAGNDRVITSIGNVTTASGDLNDTILGGGGNDTVSVAQGEDRFEGGTGNDLLIADFSAATTYSLNSGGEFAPDASGYSGQFFTGGRIEGAVVFTGVDRFDVTGTKFNDAIRTGGNNDTLNGGAGDDDLNSGAGKATIDGGDGIDTWRADLSAFSNAFNFDAARAGTRNIGSGNTITSVESLYVTSGAGNDSFLTYANGKSDSIDGGGGNDTIRVGGGADTVIGGDGSDLLIVDYSAKATNFVSTPALISNSLGDIVSYSGIERLQVTMGSGNDNIVAGAGSDTIAGGAGNDTLTAGDGNDRVNGGDGNDTLTGGSGADTMNGGAGSDKLTGGDGNDSLTGSDGADTLEGGSGNDTMAGGSQADVFRFASVNAGADRITDFNKNADRFDLGGDVFDSVQIAGSDTILRYDGGSVRVEGINNLSLAQWNALVLPGGSGAGAALPGWAALQHEAGFGLTDLDLMQVRPGEWVFA